LPQLFGLLRPEIGERGARCRWERGSLGSYRGAVDLRWDRSVGYWRCPGLAGPARSRRGQWWTAGRVCALFSLRNDPPEESRSPCAPRARGEPGDGVCFRICSRGVGATGINQPPAFLDAYLKGEVDRLVVVEHLAAAPSPQTASGWLPEFINSILP